MSCLLCLLSYFVLTYQSKIRSNTLKQCQLGLLKSCVVLGDGNLRMHGIHGLLSIQQTHKEITERVWSICHSLNLVINPVSAISRGNWKIIYTFQSLTMPYFTTLWHEWYSVVNGRSIKRLPANILDLLTPLALAHWIMGDGSFDGYGRGLGRVVLHTDNFTHDEVQLLRDILKSKFNIESTLKKGNLTPYEDIKFVFLLNL